MNRTLQDIADRYNLSTEQEVLDFLDKQQEEQFKQNNLFLKKRWYD